MVKSLADLSPLERVRVLPLLSEPQPGCGKRQVLDLLSPLCTVQVPDHFEPTEAQSALVAQLLRPVAVLYCFAQTAALQFPHVNHLYLLGNAKAEPLFQHPKDMVGSRDQKAPANLRRQLEALATLGVIYRFNAARRFGYQHGWLMQMRVSSWGEALAREWRVETTTGYTELSAYLAGIFSAYRPEYEQLIALCTSAARPLAVERIHALNEAVPFSVVT
jgi:hypothetical protein